MNIEGLTAGCNSVDIVAVVLIVLGTMNGFRRGLSGELAATAGTVFALLVGLQAYMPLGALAAEHTRLSEQSAHALAFLVAVVAAAVVYILVRAVLKSVITIAVNSKFGDHILGLVAGCIKTTVLVAIIFLGVNMWPHPFLNRVFGSESVIGSALSRHLPEFQQQAEEIGDKVTDGLMETGE